MNTLKYKSSKFILILILLLASFLRLWKLEQVPISLFGDELDAGYQAYSILKTGKDYMGNPFPIHFRSLADFRTPLYLYSLVPTVAMFGITPLGVRLPAAIFGILGVFLLFLLVEQATGNKKIALASSLLLAISPWHLQYSRAGFEVTQLLFLLLSGLYFFIKGLKQRKWLGLSAVFFALTPWAYNTAKLFLPLILLAIVFIWFKDLVRLPRRFVISSVAIFLIIITPFAISTVLGGGVQRFNYLSIFSDPTLEPQIGFGRVRESQMTYHSQEPQDILLLLNERIFYNKVWLLAGTFTNNYLQAYSTDFLFVKGDPDLRQSIGTVGEFYKFEFPLLILGIIFLFNSTIDKRFKSLILFWLVAGPIPSALTVDGGNHATRLILELPPLIFIMSCGLIYILESLPKRFVKVSLSIISLTIFLSAALYLHDYWIKYPWDSERWWHAGYKEAIQSSVEIGKNYKEVILSDASEPALIFLLGYSQYSPAAFQSQLPLPKVVISGFDETTKLDNYYLTPVGSQQDLYKLGSILPKDAIYLATTKEVPFNLIEEPKRLPKDLKLLKMLNYPSGEPAFYILTKNSSQI